MLPLYPLWLSARRPDAHIGSPGRDEVAHGMLPPGGLAVTAHLSDTMAGGSLALGAKSQLELRYVTVAEQLMMDEILNHVGS